MKRAYLLIFGILVTVVCIAVLMQFTSFERLKAGFQEADYQTLPVMLIFLAGFYWLKVLRWQWLLAPTIGLSVRQLFSPMMIGFASNNVLPAHLGEFIRVFVVRQKYGVPASTVLSTVVLERIFDVLAILTLFGIGLMFTEGLPDRYQQGAAILGIISGCVVAMVTLYLIWTEQFLRLFTWTLSRTPFVPEKFTLLLINMLRQGADGLASLRSARAVILIAASSLLQWLLNGLIAFVALKSFHIDVTPATGLIVTGVTAFGVTIPATPGYFGVIQMCFHVSMSAQEIKPDPSLVLGASVYYQLSMYIPVTAIGFWCLVMSGLRLKDLKRAANPEKVLEGTVVAPEEPFAGKQV